MFRFFACLILFKFNLNFPTPQVTFQFQMYFPTSARAFQLQSFQFHFRLSNLKLSIFLFFSNCFFQLYVSRLTKYARNPFLVQKKVCRSSEPRVEFVSQTHLHWCREILRTCTKSAHSNNLKCTKSAI